MSFIQGEKFIGLANGVNIFYSHTHDVLEFLKNTPKNQFILITHNSDKNLDISPVPENCIKWYSQNVNIVHPKIESIPIGLENSQWFPEVRKIEKIKAKLNETKTYRNLVYMNHNIGTNPVVRERIYQLYEGESWVTTERGSNKQGRFDEYIDNIYNHKFVICPEGNGIDTHRTWETLYLGSIPIEKRNLNNRFYTDLPICFIENWEDLTDDYLELEFIRIKSGNWNTEKHTFEYWKNKIQNESK